MRNLLKWVGLFAVCMVMALLLTPAAHASAAIPSMKVLGPALLGSFIGSTTGTKSSGTDFIGLNDMMKNVYTGPFENNIEKDSEVADIFEKAEGFEVVDGPDGKQVTIGHIFSSGGGVGAMNEDDYLYTPTTPTTKQGAITIKQLTAVVELSGRTLRRVRKGPAAFVSWADEALPRKAQRLAFHRDRMYIGSGTGIIFRITQAGPSGTGDTIGNSYGITGLENAANMVLRDDNLKWGPNANGTALRALTAKVVSVTYGTDALTVDQLPTAGAQNDYVFLGDANVQGAGKELMGLEGIIDDGNVLGTIQTLSRTTYPELKSQVIDSSSATLGYNQTLSEDILDYSDSLCYERGNLGRPTIILVNRSGQRSFWKSLKGDRVLNDPKGNYQGGKAKLKMQLGDRIVTVQAARKVPLSRCYGVDPRTIKRYTIGSGRWDDTDGSIWNRTVDGTGRKDAFFAVYVQEEEVGVGDPSQSFKITNLAAA